MISASTVASQWPFSSSSSSSASSRSSSPSTCVSARARITSNHSSTTATLPPHPHPRLLQDPNPQRFQTHSIHHQLRCRLVAFWRRPAHNHRAKSTITDYSARQHRRRQLAVQRRRGHVLDSEHFVHTGIGLWCQNEQFLLATAAAAVWWVRAIAELYRCCFVDVNRSTIIYLVCDVCLKVVRISTLLRIHAACYVSYFILCCLTLFSVLYLWQITNYGEHQSAYVFEPGNILINVKSITKQEICIIYLHTTNTLMMTSSYSPLQQSLLFFLSLAYCLLYWRPLVAGDYFSYYSSNHLAAHRFAS